MKHKLKSKSGETLIETLFALLVVALAMTMLAGSIVTAARVNKGAEDLKTEFQVSNRDEISDVMVTVVHQTGPNSVVSVKAYKTNDDNEYCYYTTN